MTILPSKPQSGYLIVYAMILMFGLMTVGVVTLSVVSASYSFTRDDINRKNAANMARACANVIADELNANANFTGFSPAAKTMYDRTGQNGTRSTCVVDSITNGTGNQKIVQLTTYEYRRNSDPNPVAYRAQAVMEAEEAVTEEGHPASGGILIGYGGMYSGGTGSVRASQINILGQLIVEGTGDVSIDDNGPLNVHNIACGTTNWPQPCSGNPISRSGTADIYGDICAPGQTNTNRLYHLDTSCTLPEVTMPVFDKAGFVAGLTGPTISASSIISDGGCYRRQGGDDLGQTFNVPAGATITGSFNFSNVPNLDDDTICRIVFHGDTYITGGVTGDLNSSGSRVDFGIADSVTENITIVMNRQMRITKPGRFRFNPNSSGRIAHLINFNSSNTSCSDSSTVPSSTVSTCLSPTEARTSATSQAYAGLRIDSSSSEKQFSGITIYAYYSQVDIGGGTGTIRFAAIAGQSLGGFSGTTNIRLTIDDPTFGIPVPSSTAGRYQIIDFVQR